MSHSFIRILSASIIVFACHSTHATSVSYGFREAQSQMLETLQHSGMLNLEKTTVSGITEINGFITAKNSTLNSLTVNGDADLDHVLVKGSVLVQGKLAAEDANFQEAVVIKGQINAEDSHFNKTITIYGNHSEFENCHLENIILEKNNDQKVQHLYLEETQVDGDITFKSHGIIHMDKESKIVGKVTGGKIEV